MTNIILALTGSVASIKLKDLIQNLKTINDEVNLIVICTQNSKHFIQNEIVKSIEKFKLNGFELDLKWNCYGVPLFDDEIEWTSWNNRNDPVIHIELRKWADLILIAPLDANTLAKISNGICDNLLTSLIRAWDIKKPQLCAPAMNTFMYEHPHTAKHLKILEEELNFIIVPPKVKLLACGDYGIGAMEEPSVIGEKVKLILNI